jgi:hypothetical protein
VVWEVPNGDMILLDGHNRFEIAAKHGGIHFEVKKIHFSGNDRERAKLWIIRNQLGRRNLKKLDAIALKAEEDKLTAVEAKQKIGGDKKSETYQKSLPLNQGNDKHQNSTNAKMAHDIGISEDTYRKGKKILESGTTELIEAVRSGEKSINAGYREVIAAEIPVPKKSKDNVIEAKLRHDAIKQADIVSMDEIRQDRVDRRSIARELYQDIMTITHKAITTAIWNRPDDIGDLMELIPDDKWPAFCERLDKTIYLLERIKGERKTWKIKVSSNAVSRH